MSDWRDDLLRYLPASIRRRAQDLSEAQAQAVTEIRMRAGQRVEFVTDRSGAFELEWRPGAPEVQATLAALCDHSAYARQEEICQGFVTVRGGHRVGLCGRASVQEGRIVGLHTVGSLCIRIARPILGAADGLLPALFDAMGRPQSTLILSPPGCGKTTVLRDAIRQLSQRGQHVCVADERSELCAVVDGVPQMPVGSRTDVMDGCPKAQAMQMLLRAMNPDWIVTDELGRAADAQAVLDAMRCGVAVLASAHADGLTALRSRPELRGLMDAGAFSGYVLLQRRGRIASRYDARGEALHEA